MNPAKLDRYDDTWEGMELSSDGHYVLFDDHVSAITKLQKLNATLLRQRNEARAQALCRNCGGSTYIVVNDAMNREPKP